MFSTVRIRDDFNASADHYETHALLQQKVMQSLVLQLELIAKPEQLTSEARILDAGCGTGFLSSFVKRPVVSLDIAQRMCIKAQQKGNQAVNADMALLPFADSAFDIVFSSLALQWSRHPVETVNEWLRVIKPGGVLAFSTFCEGTLAELAESFHCIDGYDHITRFAPVSAFRHLHAERLWTEQQTEYYTNMFTLARHLKSLGARHKGDKRRRSLVTPRQFHKVQEHYQTHYGTAQGLPVSWNVLYCVMRKP